MPAILNEIRTILSPTCISKDFCPGVSKDFVAAMEPNSPSETTQTQHIVDIGFKRHIHNPP